MELSEDKKALLAAGGHILVLGGPGSGKTTISLMKAKEEIQSFGLAEGQRILFLSFARATVARVEEQTQGLQLPDDVRRCIEVNTYHGFTWGVLRSHGYLLNSKAPLRLLPPPEAASRLAGVGKAERDGEKRRLFMEEGLLHFDLFAFYAGELIGRSSALAGVLQDTYPVIVLDEFQDTNADEWQLIRVLGQGSRLIALADPDQRIYEFRGANPARIREFVEGFTPTTFDFGSENYRSPGTDITQFGTDLLSGANKGREYSDVTCIRYPFRKGDWRHVDLKVQVLHAIRRLRASGTAEWSLAVLVPTKRLMLAVSDYLDAEQEFGNARQLPHIHHEVAIEAAGPSLAAAIIAGLLEGHGGSGATLTWLIKALCAHMRGRQGDKPATMADMELSEALLAFADTRQVRGKNRQRIVQDARDVVAACMAVTFTGDPGEDWLTIVTGHLGVLRNRPD